MSLETQLHPSIGVLLEQTLGHVTHGRNLKRTLAATDKAEFRFRELPFGQQHFLDAMPPRSNWTVRSSMAARSAIRGLEADKPLDALLVHTHVPATFIGDTMERVPTVVSIDATPKQIDSLGGSYQHSVQHDVVESLKHKLHAKCFDRASSLVAWSTWAANSLVDDYGVDRDRIRVIPPGVAPSQWQRSELRQAGSKTIRILFVGGDFQRKGGDLLLAALEQLRADPQVLKLGINLELHLVTSAKVATGPGVHVHNGLTPNSPELIALFQECDIFALPTFGDCTPLVLAEAATAGLPAVATDVGAISESVLDGKTGHLVEIGSVESLSEGLRRLVIDDEHRLKLGHAASEHAAASMDSDKNALAIMEEVIRCSPAKAGTPRVMLTVSGVIDDDIEAEVATGARPLADYLAIARETDATLLDWRRLDKDASKLTKLVRWFAGNSIALAVHLYTHRKEIDLVISDGEQVGLPLAALMRARRATSFRHVMIAHRLSPAKKASPVRLFGIGRNIDEILVYSTAQFDATKKLYDRRGPQVKLIDFMVDTDFFRPATELLDRPGDRRPVLCSAGREFRDYPTLIEAVRGLDVDLIIASASPWSKRSDNAYSDNLPDNVKITSFTQAELRNQLDETDFLVMPLIESDFQAGITTILEAMSMERPVICTATSGQTDVVIDRVNGVYVPPGDVAAMRDAIKWLAEQPELAAKMGKSGRELVLDRADVRDYAAMFGDIVRKRLKRRAKKDADVTA